MKKLVIIGCAIFLVGAIIFASVFIFFREDTVMGFKTQFEEKNYTSGSAVTSIIVSDKNTPITVGLSDDNSIHLVYYENEREYYNITDRDGALIIQKQDDYRWYDHIFSVNFHARSFTLLLPKSFSGSLSIDTSNGKISIDDVTTSALTAKSSNGAISIGNVACSGNIKTDTSNGRVEFNNITAEALDCDTSNGAVNVSGLNAQRLDIETSNGAVSLNAVSAASLSVSSSNSRIEVINLESSSITLKTNNGRISGSIVGSMRDFTIISSTSNGSNSLPSSLPGGNKNLNAHTSNGAIDLSFTND